MAFLTNPYALYLMKLFAFRDEEEGKKGVGRQDYARKHAQDIATITALLTESETAELPAYGVRHAGHPLAQEAVQIVDQYFHGEAQARAAPHDGSGRSRGTAKPRPRGSY